MSDKKVAVLGLGATGLSCVNFLLSQNYDVTVFDTRQLPPGEDKLNASVELIKGQLDAGLLAEFKLIIASPGIALATPALQFALQAGCEIIGDIELFARAQQQPEYAHAKLVTITGSNGKSTVTSLLGEMACEAGVKTAVGGNIGIPALDLLAPEIELYILELSSFQLETTFSLNADVATILNVSEDHLDRYESYQDYTQAKHRIYQQSRNCLFNRDDLLTLPKVVNKAQVSFGFDSSAYGLVCDAQNNICLARNGQALLSTASLKLSGKHNWMNALAALALGDAVNLDEQAMLQTLQSYTGLKHRCEFIAQRSGIRWINDSKATNIGAALAALQGLSETISGDVHVILGGDGKGADFSELSTVLEEIQGLILCFGADGQKIAAFNSRAVVVNDLQQAVAMIAAEGKTGDLAILSPACASLDMYPNFMARGDHFRNLVTALQAGGV
ncbi:UDP-N-acetylmuramoyl-L-alanine--D-glutamate ligase [Psychromonas ossibalaenae]|uniref:UDP-N-acetylmuramoyl-L-alanine--D-glutamate ligase n=1 Tax=Psychromonas ossibalaenae TaxID=444922 RepID=UPI000381B35A|nr:UDP-N-acetylmuramoyl-L-alanine--D-glutamate ligase [Psychromonas ossibalaenae]